MVTSPLQPRAPFQVTAADGLPTVPLPASTRPVAEPMPGSGVCVGPAPRGLMLEIRAHAHPDGVREECFDKRVQHFPVFAGPVAGS